MGKGKRRSKPDVNDLLHRLAAEEDAFLTREFFAPALRGGIVHVRIGNILCKIRIEPANFVGWGVFQPTSHSQATLVREASLAERKRYLELFPLIRLIACRRARNRWFGSAAHFGDKRIRIEGLAPVQLVDEVQLFDCIRTRYDGARFWYEDIELRRDPGASTYLRAQLNELTDPDSLDRPGLTPEERAAYELNYWSLVEPERLRNHEDGEADDESNEIPSDAVRSRLADNLSHAGAQLVDYLERADGFRVTYVVGGRQYTSSVNKDDLSVQVAGICLSGEDRKFDLASMAGVLREGDQGHDILRVGDEYGWAEDDYWQTHPPT